MKIVRRKTTVEAPAMVAHEIQSSLEPVGTIAIPTRDHMNAATARSLVFTALALPKMLGPESVIDFFIIQGSALVMQRNEAVQRMRGDWLIFIDDDMTWEPSDIQQLIEDAQENDLDMVGGLCFRRGEPYNPTLYMREAPTAGRYNFLESWDSDIVEVDATGMAFVLIRLRVFERIAAWNNELFPSAAERAASDPPDYFRWYGGLGEDLRFCQDAKAAGCRIFVDTRVKIGHVGERSIGHKQFLEELAMRDEATEAMRRVVNGEMGLPTVNAEDAKAELGWIPSRKGTD